MIIFKDVNYLVLHKRMYVQNVLIQVHLLKLLLHVIKLMLKI